MKGEGGRQFCDDCHAGCTEVCARTLPAVIHDKHVLAILRDRAVGVGLPEDSRAHAVLRDFARVG